MQTNPTKPKLTFLALYLVLFVRCDLGGRRETQIEPVIHNENFNGTVKNVKNGQKSDFQKL